MRQMVMHLEFAKVQTRYVQNMNDNTFPAIINGSARIAVRLIRAIHIIRKRIFRPFYPPILKLCKNKSN